MKYCTRCKRVFQNRELSDCPRCGRALREHPHHYSPVDVLTANGFELERVKAALTEARIPFTVQEVKKDAGIQILNAAPPENCKLFVPLSFYNDACELLIGIGALKESEPLDEAEDKRLKEERKKDDPEEMSPRKRFWVKFFSILLFIALIAAAVFLADLLIPLINPSFH